MATPGVAGAAALVRQYFMEGFYPSGSKTAKDGFTPSGALLKATLVNSAQKMDYYGSSNSGNVQALGEPPGKHHSTCATQVLLH